MAKGSKKGGKPFPPKGGSAKPGYPADKFGKK